jgi:AbrB family looped-hinge helix DNA binding protein
MKMKIFTKGQVVIPAPIRAHFGIEPGDLIEISENIAKNCIEIKPVLTSMASDLAGSLSKYKRKKPFPAKKDIQNALEMGLLNES